MSLLVLLNALIMMLKWPSMPSYVQLTVEIVTYFCTMMFILEAVMKLTAFGKAYFRDSWNRFDLAIVIGSLIFIAPANKQERSLITFIRTIKLFKIIMIQKRFQSLKLFYITITRTALSLMNVGLLMVLIIYIFSIIGVQLFAHVKLTEPMTRLYNFQSVSKAFLTLYRVMTRDHWNELLEAVSIQNSIDTQCIDSPSYEDYRANGFVTVGCGKPLLAVLYFFTYSFLISVVFLSLFIAIIQSAYFNATNKYKDRKVEKQIERFRILWSNYDRQATGVIKDEDLEKILLELGEPFGLSERHRFDLKLIHHYKQSLGMNMPQHIKEPTNWYFHEVLDQLLILYLVSHKV
jgi:hypothetical protein